MQHTPSSSSLPSSPSSVQQKYLFISFFIYILLFIQALLYAIQHIVSWSQA